jgi:hypothetical protein
MADKKLVGVRYNIPYNGTWMTLLDAKGHIFRIVDDEPEDVTGATEDALRVLIEEYERNRLAFFLPHGGGRDFLNDWESEIVMLTAGIRGEVDAIHAALRNATMGRR